MRCLASARFLRALLLWEGVIVDQQGTPKPKLNPHALTAVPVNATDKSTPQHLVQLEKSEGPSEIPALSSSVIAKARGRNGNR